DHLNECRIQAHQARSPVPADPRANRPARDPSPSQEARTRQTTRQSRQERLTLAEIPNEATNTLIRSISYEATNYFARRYRNEVTGSRPMQFVKYVSAPISCRVSTTLPHKRSACPANRSNSD